MARIISVIALLLCITLIPFGIASNHSAQAQPAPLVNCIDHVHPTTVEVVCTATGITLLDVNVPRPVVTVTVPPVRITVGHTRTITLPAIPGPTRTVTAHATVYSTAHATTTQTPGSITKTIHSTQSVTARSTQTTFVIRHPERTHATLEHNSGQVFPRITLGTTASKATFGLLALIILTALILIGMYLGYYIGYTDADKKENKFLRALLKTIRKH